MADLYCSKCQKTLKDTNFYQLKNGNKSDLCKACETMHINNRKPETFLWLLEKYDVPYMPWIWNSIADKQYQKDPYKFNGMSVFGRYLMQMKLTQNRNYSWADTEKIQFEHDKEIARKNQLKEEQEEEVEEMRKAFERGEIPEAQYLTYKEMNAEPETPPHPAEGYPANDHPFVEISVPDIGEELTQEDKIYLMRKWGKLYTAADWIYMEQKYHDFMSSFDIQGAARIDTLIQICKLSLKCNQALDSGDTDSYSKLTRAYDSLMKSAKFTESQRKEEKSGDFDSVGQIVFFAEKEGGKIARYKLDTPLDYADKALNALKKYNRELILSDPSLAKQLENYLIKREALEQNKKDKEDAEAAGEDYVQLTNEDFKAYHEMIQKDIEGDVENGIG